MERDGVGCGKGRGRCGRAVRAFRVLWRAMIAKYTTPVIYEPNHLRSAARGASEKSKEAAQWRAALETISQAPPQHTWSSGVGGRDL